jgi:hypothetical protein
MSLDLSGEEAADLADSTGNGRYLFSERRREQPQRRGADAIMSAAC